MHVYGYWQYNLGAGTIYLNLRVDARDVQKGNLDVDYYCDADHASEYHRKSVGGTAAMLHGEHSLGLRRPRRLNKHRPIV